MFITKVENARTALGPRGLELVAVLFSTLLCLLVTIADNWCAGNLFGLGGSSLKVDVASPLETLYIALDVASPLETAYLAINLNVIITATHLAWPVRWAMIWPAEVAPLLSFWWAILACEGPLGRKVVFAGMFAGLVIGAGLGRRMVEKLEREAFATVADERTRRCEAEHRLHMSTANSQQQPLALEEEADTGAGRVEERCSPSSEAVVITSSESVPESIRTEQTPAPQFFTVTCADIADAWLHGVGHLNLMRVGCERTRDTLKGLLEQLIDPRVGGALVVIAEPTALRTVFGGSDHGVAGLGDGVALASLRTCDEGYMNSRLRALHVSDERFAETLRDFTAHTDNDRWPDNYPDEEARGRPKDGALLLSTTGYRVNCCVKLLGFRPAGKWDNVGTKHEVALACARFIPGSFVFVKSSAGILHFAVCNGEGLSVYQVLGRDIAAQVHELSLVGFAGC